MKRNNSGGNASNELMIAAGQRSSLAKRQNNSHQIKREKKRAEQRAERRARRTKTTTIKRGFGQ